MFKKIDAVVDRVSQAYLRLPKLLRFCLQAVWFPVQVVVFFALLPVLPVLWLVLYAVEAYENFK